MQSKPAMPKLGVIPFRYVHSSIGTREFQHAATGTSSLIEFICQVCQVSTLETCPGSNQFPMSKSQIIHTIGEAHNEFAISELDLRCRAVVPKVRRLGLDIGKSDRLNGLA
jgi:hypothetical protein